MRQSSFSASLTVKLFLSLKTKTNGQVQNYIIGHGPERRVLKGMKNLKHGYVMYHLPLSGGRVVVASRFGKVPSTAHGSRARHAHLACRMLHEELAFT